MPAFPEPDDKNLYLVEHVNALRESFRRYLGRDLLDPNLSEVEAAREAFFAPFVLLSHDTAADPLFNYGNKMALALFEMSWQELTVLPSRKSAEVPNRIERARLLNEVSSKGYIENYSGVRISKSGKRFAIAQATVWNLIDKNGTYYGQAAVFDNWEYI